LLALLNPEFAELDLTQLGEGDRKKLAQYFIQRRRADVLRWLGEETPFPSRESKEVGYAMPLSSPYRKLFDDVFAFARERITEQDADAPAHRQRVRYWAALALLRCIMSSPAAAEKALRSRASSVSDKQHAPDETESMAWLTGDENEDEVDNLLGGYVYDATDQDGAQDTEPSHMVEHGSSRSERDRLRRFAARAAALVGDDDPKLQATLKLVESLLKDGYSPIIYCRYIATAGYLADHIKARITRYGNDLRVLAITGERSEDEREMLVEELCEYPQRVLVATDCLSEGINLQHAFDAVVHYDLPWNPNRLEQREGRVDRYGQRKLKVRTSLIASQDNPMDEAVMKVLLRKAIEIHRTLGISVPLPTSSKEVLDTLIGDLFFQGKEQTSFLEQAKQMMIGEDGESSGLEQRWKQVVDRERQSRTRFAQQRIKPEEVARELEESDAVLGDVVTVASFVRDACERLGGVLIPESARSLAGVDRLALGGLPQAVRERVQPAFAPRPGAALPETVWITFSDPAPSAEVHVVGRNHPLTVALADYLMGMALTWDDSQDLPPASRCSVIRSRAVQERTVLLVLRVRMMLQSSGRGGKDVPSILAEEVVVTGYRGSPSQVCWLEESEALKLLQQEVLPDQNVQQEEKRLTLERAIEQVQQMEAELVRLAEERASRLQESHQRVRRATGQGATRVSPADAPDVLGVYVITPPLPAGS
jgi:hypothetical protein